MNEKPRKKKTLHLARAERQTALALVETLLVRRFDRNDIVKALHQQFGPLPKDITDHLFYEVYNRWREDSANDRDGRLDNQRRSLQRLYRNAEADKDWRVCVDIEKLLARIDGTEAPKKVAMTSQVAFASDFEGRSVEDLEYFSVNGHFPEQAPKTGA